ncbi:hypothetical protein GCM10023183_08110 [Nibribacter koreensis]|uniref:Glycosyl-4,4'-diaponeurosporenoate acyltransferase n=2 Tax=Nibribacter koreensis TaxID=1084519 RepID=A0ABP8FAN9_9BACT
MTCVFIFTETLKSDLSSGYYREKKWERNGKLYENLGINFFRKVLVWIGWEKLNKKSNPVKNDPQDLNLLEYRTKQSELGHLIILFVVFGFSLFVAIEYGAKEAIWLIALNIILNLYPILLQRYNRPRIQKAIRVSNSREKRLSKTV